MALVSKANLKSWQSFLCPKVPGVDRNLSASRHHYLRPGLPKLIAEPLAKRDTEFVVDQVRNSEISELLPLPKRPPTNVAEPALRSTAEPSSNCVAVNSALRCAM